MRRKAFTFARSWSLRFRRCNLRSRFTCETVAASPLMTGGSAQDGSRRDAEESGSMGKVFSRICASGSVGLRCKRTLRANGLHRRARGDARGARHDRSMMDRSPSQAVKANVMRVTGEATA